MEGTCRRPAPADVCALCAAALDGVRSKPGNVTALLDVVAKVRAATGLQVMVSPDLLPAGALREARPVETPA